MENGGLRRNVAVMRQSLYDEGIVDGQFARLEQTYRNHPFLEQHVKAYLRDSARMLATVEQRMNTTPTDFSEMDRILHWLCRECYAIGLRKVRNEIDRTRGLLQERNLKGARVAFQDVRNQHDILRTRIVPYFKQLKLEAQHPALSPW